MDTTTLKEVMVVSTEDLQPLIEKHFFTSPCKPRILGSINMNTKEFHFNPACRAEITKLIMNNGYKFQDFRTFVK